jgi:hypothetical protein
MLLAGLLVAGSGYAASVSCLTDGYQADCGSAGTSLNAQAFDLGGGVLGIQFHLGPADAAILASFRSGDQAIVAQSAGSIHVSFVRSQVVAIANRVESGRGFYGASAIAPATDHLTASLFAQGSETPEGYWEEFEARTIMGKALPTGEQVTVVMQLGQAMAARGPAVQQSGGAAVAVLQALGIDAGEPAAGPAASETGASASSASYDAAGQGAPEPATYLMIAAGLIGVGAFRRRR